MTGPGHMMRFVATNEQTKARVLGLGLSFENLRKLKRDQPILFDLNDVELQFYRDGKPVDGQILIFAGASEHALARAVGLVGLPPEDRTDDA